MKSPSVRIAVALTLAALAAPGCKLFKRQHPSGRLARTDSPAQFTSEYPDQTSPAWMQRMNVNSPEGRYFEARDTGKLHVWLRFGCTSRDGEFTLRGQMGYRVQGLPPVAPVPVVVTARGATISGLPRGDESPIIIHAPRQSAEGGMETDGYIYLFDVDVPQQQSVTLDGQLTPEAGARCPTNSLEVWRD